MTPLRLNCVSPLAPRPFTLALSILLASALAGSAALAQSKPLRATEPAAGSMPAAGAAAKPAAGSMPAAGAAAKPAAGLSGGKVLETMNAGNYTYARVETPAGEKWVAGPQTALKVGDAVQWPGGSEMKDFSSKTLDRTFESILFVGQLMVRGAPAGAGGGSPHGALSGKAPAAPEVDVKGIAKAEGGLTIAEIYDRRAEFDGKEIVVRGKVVKFNAAVMGRNWLHLRDGTHGAAGDNDLTVTSDGQAAVGNTVLVRGKVVLNQDFGFNYRYDIIIEKASITVE
jgi:hypothetical protein